MRRLLSLVALQLMLLPLCWTENVHIGAVLSSTENLNFLSTYVHQVRNREDVIEAGLTFNVTAQLMDLNPIRSAASICTDMVTKQVHVVIASHPPASSQSPISVSYTCGYYGIPLVGIYARDSAFSDKVRDKCVLW